MQASAKLLQSVNALMSLPKISSLVRTMAQEMEKVLGDRSCYRPADLHGLVDEEVDNVLSEILSDKTRKVQAPTSSRTVADEEVASSDGTAELHKRIAELC
uniref:Uncharacterized protein n=1 Tax=Spongospora subterranea TaxID=70186 RepID=A0A0H5R017_9EUKA|eukprot:CRZ01174.1 hypothetical protein [Spongospora subterranea]